MKDHSRHIRMATIAPMGCSMVDISPPPLSMNSVLVLQVVIEHLVVVEATQKDCFTPADRDPDHVQRI